MWALAGSTIGQSSLGGASDSLAILAIAVVLAAGLAGMISVRSSTGRSALPRLLGAPG
jgi:hypothetical protein